MTAASYNKQHHYITELQWIVTGLKPHRWSRILCKPWQCLSKTADLQTLRTRPRRRSFIDMLSLSNPAPSAPAAVPCHCAKIWRRSNSRADAWGAIHPVGCRVSFVLGSLRSFGAAALCWIWREKEKKCFSHTPTIKAGGRLGKDTTWFYTPYEKHYIR